MQPTPEPRMWRPAAHSEEEDKVTGRRAEEEPSGADREALLFSKWPTVHELNVSSLSSTAAVGGLKNKNCCALPYFACFYRKWRQQWQQKEDHDPQKVFFLKCRRALGLEINTKHNSGTRGFIFRKRFQRCILI